MDLLIISNNAPFDSVGAAGEKTHNFYLKELAKEDIKVNLVTVCSEKDYDKLDYNEYGISSTVLVEKQDKISVFIRKCTRAARYVLNSKDRYANFLSPQRQKFFIKSVEDLKTSGYKPDCIILEFTHCILLAEKMKQIFPNVPIVGSSHDVSYKGSQRIFDYEKNKIKKFFRKRQYENLKVREISALSLLDYIIPQNQNDISILKSNEILKDKKYHKIVPYYDSYAEIERKPDGKTIIFYGSMSRKENYLSVIEFIENAFFKLQSDKELVIIGGNPPEILKNYESDKIHITGFLPLEEVKQYFSTCECMIVPLILGSGIKVKILEALSGAVPVITNNIGNEGIFAKDREQIVLCKNSNEFIQVLDNYSVSSSDLQKIGQNGKKYVLSEFSLEESRKEYIKLIKEIASN